MNNPQLTADEIKKLAKQKNVSISKLLLDCGLNKNALYTMQNSGYYPRVEALIKIADYLECSVDYLLGRNYKPIDTSNDIEKKLLDVFRQLTDEGQKAAMNYLTFMSTDTQYQKYTDIPKEA